MQNTLTNHMRNFVDGKVSVLSLSTAAQAERVDRATANAVLMLLAGWEHSASSGNDLRARVRNLI
jgi:hypothetical protein